MERVKIKDKIFKPYLREAEIQAAIGAIAKDINRKYIGKNPVFLGVLNGCFYFAADLMKQIDLECEVSFVKVASYSGTESTGHVRQLLGLDRRLQGRHVVVMEDIVDTGNTIEAVKELLENMGVESVTIATLLFKPDAYEKDMHIDYVALEIPNAFVVGYGLDYDGYGRNLNDLYILAEEQDTLKEDDSMMNLVLFGPPGAGKGTQAELLKNELNLVHLSTGDLLRSEIKEGTELGLEAQSYMNKGELVPDEVVIGMIESKLVQHAGAKGFIFDGFPRTTEQAKALDKLLEQHRTEIDLMLSLEVDDEELVARIVQRGMESGREDDKNESVIFNRIVTYNKKTAPLKEYYASQNKSHKIEGVGTVEDVFQRLMSTIKAEG